MISLLGIGVAWALTRFITRPIGDLVRGARDVREGRYGRPVEVWSADELGSLAAAFNEMTAALADKERVRRELRRRAIEAAEDERKRVSRDIHDDAGQRLVSLLAGFGAAEAEAPDEASRARLAELREIASQTLAGLHEVAVGLRPSVLDDVGLCAALRRHASAFEKRSGVAVRCVGIDAELSPRLAPEIEVALYRIVQEALTNAYRVVLSWRLAFITRSGDEIERRPE